MLIKFLPVLVQCPLFKGLDEAGIKSLLPCFRPKMSKCHKGEVISRAGETQDSIGIVLAGEIQIVNEDYAGNRLIIGVFGPGELFGEVAAFAGTGRWPNTVMASQPAQVLFLPIEKISQPCCSVCDFHQRLIRNMLSIVAAKALNMNSRINYLKMRGMREKLSAYLFEQYRLTGSRNFLLPVNRDQLAEFLNVSRPSMSRELGRMKAEGIIDFYRSAVTLNNLGALQLSPQEVS